MTARRRRLTWALALAAAGVLAVLVTFEWKVPFELWHIHQLDASDPAARDAALEALVKLRSTRGATACFERWVTAAGDAAPRFPIYEAAPPLEGWLPLLRFGPTTAPVLAAGLRSERANVRGWAAALLGHLGARAAGAGQALLVALGDVEPTVRKLATLALGRVIAWDRKLLEECAALVVDGGQQLTVREGALEALAAAVKAQEELRLWAADVGEGARSREEWEVLFGSPPQTVLESGEQHRDILLSSLERAATCDAPRLREAALRHLCLLTVRRDEEDVPHVPQSVRSLIHRGLSDVDETVQLTAVLFVRAAQPLSQEALARAWQLLPVLAREEEGLHGMARSALLEIPEPWPPEAWAGLATCLRDPDLVHFNYAERFHAESEPAMDLLRNALVGASTVARENALAIVDDLPLASTPVPRLWEPVLRTLAHEHAHLADAAIAPASRIARTGTVEPDGLLELLRSDRAEVRRRAAVVLGARRWQSELVAPPLRAALDDADEAVQAAALRSWAAAGETETAAIVLEASRRLSSSPHAAVRRIALEVLDRSGRNSPEATAALRRAASDDPDPDVRAAAAALRAE